MKLTFEGISEQSSVSAYSVGSFSPQWCNPYFSPNLLLQYILSGIMFVDFFPPQWSSKEVLTGGQF